MTEEKNAELVIGDNGTPAHATMGSQYKSQLAEIFQWMRGTPDNAIRDNLKTFLEKAIQLRSDTAIQELFLLISFIREPRKGKGERQLVYVALLELLQSFPLATNFIIENLKNIGYWGDYEALWTLTTDDELKRQIVKIFAKTLQEDQTNVANGEAPSLCAKWAPSEKSNKILARNIARIVFPGISGSPLFLGYRKLLTLLRTKINLVETHLCNGTTAEISPGAIPSKAATLYSKALRNVKQSAWPKVSRRPKGRVSTNERFEYGHPNYEDREQCKANILEFLANHGEMKAAVAELYTIVAEIFNNPSSVEDPIRQSQWDARIRDLQQKILTLKAENPAYSHPNILSVVDLSGSMEGVQGEDRISPIVAAIMLGLFTSQIQDTPLDEPAAPFANCFFGFSTEPQLFQLPRTSKTNSSKRATLVECIDAMRPYQSQQYWGGSTNLTKVFQQILETGRRQKLRPDQMPQYVAIYSDMEFDMADGGFNMTQHQLLQQMYQTNSYEMPTVIYWDLNRSKYKKGYPVQANAPGTICLSGFSTRMLDLFLDASVEELSKIGKVAPSTKTNDSESDTDTEPSLTTLTLLEAALQHEMFDATFREELLGCVKVDLAKIAL